MKPVSTEKVPIEEAIKWLEAKERRDSFVDFFKATVVVLVLIGLVFLLFQVKNSPNTEKADLSKNSNNVVFITAQNKRAQMFLDKLNLISDVSQIMKSPVFYADSSVLVHGKKGFGYDSPALAESPACPEIPTLSGMPATDLTEVPEEKALSPLEVMTLFQQNSVHAMSPITPIAFPCWMDENGKTVPVPLGNFDGSFDRKVTGPTVFLVAPLTEKDSCDYSVRVLKNGGNKDYASKAQHHLEKYLFDNKGAAADLLRGRSCCFVYFYENQTAFDGEAKAMDFPVPENDDVAEAGK